MPAGSLYIERKCPTGIVAGSAGTTVLRWCHRDPVPGPFGPACPAAVQAVVQVIDGCVQEGR